MTVCAYVRVSSRAQDHATQRAAIERAAQARGDRIDTWYAEKMSAKTLERPELAKLRASLRMGAPKSVYAFKLDRLCRSGVADTFAVIEELRRAGVTLIVVADNLIIKPGKDDVTSEVLVFALGLAARLERAAINDRIAHARTRIEAEGGRWGRPPRMDAETIATARKMRIAGRTLRAISVALKIPKSTVAATLAASSKLASKSTPDDPQSDGV